MKSLIRQWLVQFAEYILRERLTQMFTKITQLDKEINTLVFKPTSEEAHFIIRKRHLKKDTEDMFYFGGRISDKPTMSGIVMHTRAGGSNE